MRTLGKAIGVGLSLIGLAIVVYQLPVVFEYPTPNHRFWTMAGTLLLVVGVMVYRCCRNPKVDA